MKYENLSERHIFNLIKNGGMDFDQFMEYLDYVSNVAVDLYEEARIVHEQDCEEE